MYLALKNILYLRVVCIAGSRSLIAAPRSGKEALLNYIIQPFARHFFDAISSVLLLVAKHS
jgi:transcription termination factor Rho